VQSTPPGPYSHAACSLEPCVTLQGCDSPPNCQPQGAIMSIFFPMPKVS
jgi:hypothetical protein